ncbi:MAG: ankyrin repeat domain-containing protein [Wolbachia endosymbiont of Fragariocoptes setiger]|nr:ankyrin repeat domain-containing protein [Wolbachia endosymbiont of Fragariocoptes setiger]
MLHVYTKIGSINAVKFLITSGADVYHRDKNGATALHYANIPEIICSLIEAAPKQERKFYSNIQDNDGNTPLHYLARRIQIDNKYSEVVQTLLEKGANPYVKNKDQLDAPKICNNHHFLKCIDLFERDKQFKNFCKIAVGAIILLGAAQLLLISNSMSLILLCFISAGIIYFGRRDDHYYITDVKVNELSKSLKDEINASR